MLSKFKQWLLPSPEKLDLRKQELQRRIAERESKSQQEGVTGFSFPSARGAPLPPITLSSPACPYCGVIQEPPPMRRRKCRDCGQIIHVRTDREERKNTCLLLRRPSVGLQKMLGWPSNGAIKSGRN